MNIEAYDADSLRKLVRALQAENALLKETLRKASIPFCDENPFEEKMVDIFHNVIIDGMISFPSLKSTMLIIMERIFEEMCREYLFLYAEDVPVLLSDIGQWWGMDSKRKKEVEIDIVGTPTEGSEYIIGSCKYKNEPVGVDELELIKEYVEVFGKGKKYHYYIFSKGGFTNGLKELAEKGEIRLVSLEDMYK